MKVFKELFINVENTTKEDLSKNMGAISSSNWHRQIEKEKDSPKWSLSYLHTEEKKLPEAGLWIMVKADNHNLLYVSNIIPHKSSQLSIDEYNSILEDFYRNILKPNENKLNISVEITDDTILAENKLSNETFTKLSSFCLAANKTTKASHPLDRKRWYEFIVSSYKNNEIISTNLLEGFLIDFGWSEDDSIYLIIEYEFAIGLLKEYSGND